MSSKKKFMDAMILLSAVFGAFRAEDQLLSTILLGIGFIGFLDLIRVNKPKKENPVIDIHESGGTAPLSELVLLDEQDRQIKSWDLYNKTSLLIGRESREESVDIDLGECEYSALIDTQHAVLNYCMGEWYVEDLYSQNGVRLQKAEDGIYYRVAKDRPCRLSARDKILIANTKLLIR